MTIRHVHTYCAMCISQCSVVAAVDGGILRRVNPESDLAAQDYAVFRAFANAANAADGGNAAALEHPIGNLAEAVLGEGPWTPQPETWKEAIERGQFRISFPPAKTS